MAPHAPLASHRYCEEQTGNQQTRPCANYLFAKSLAATTAAAERKRLITAKRSADVPATLAEYRSKQVRAMPHGHACPAQHTHPSVALLCGLPRRGACMKACSAYHSLRRETTHPLR